MRLRCSLTHLVSSKEGRDGNTNVKCKLQFWFCLWAISTLVNFRWWRINGEETICSGWAEMLLKSAYGRWNWEMYNLSRFGVTGNGLEACRRWTISSSVLKLSNYWDVIRSKFFTVFYSEDIIERVTKDLIVNISNLLNYSFRTCVISTEPSSTIFHYNQHFKNKATIPFISSSRLKVIIYTGFPRVL